jgi:hypothetical protein
MHKKIMPVRSNRGTFSVRRSADVLREAILTDKSKFDALTPFYVAAVCAHMEGALNNCFVEHLHRKLGKDYAKHLRPFLFLKIQDRMEMAPLLLSDYRFKLNDKHESVKAALALFDKRNQFLHVKDLWHYAEVEYGEKEAIVAWEFQNKDHPDPYRTDWGQGLFEKLSIEEIESLQKRFTKRFRTMPNSVNRKNFRPDEWLVRVTKT